MNNTAMNIHVQVFIGTYTFAFLALLFFPPSCEALIFTGKPCGCLETLYLPNPGIEHVTQAKPICVHTERGSRNACLGGAASPAFCSTATVRNQKGSRPDQALKERSPGSSISRGRWKDWNCPGPPGRSTFRKYRETPPSIQKREK